MRFNEFLQQKAIRIENFDEELNDPEDPTGCFMRVSGRRLESDQGPSYVANLMKHLRFFQKK